MAPPGTNQRKSHTKSRKGCRTCKKRHIRCDELFPQCRNCTKHNVVCDYMENPPPADEGPKVSAQPNLLLTARIDQEVTTWRRTGEFPFPEMKLRSTHQFHGLSPIDLRLVHHLASIYRDMRLADFIGCAFWVKEIPSMLEAAVGYDFVMNSILAFSASHLAWLTHSIETKNLAAYHSGSALKGLHEAIGNFSRENSDAVLAASILLAWQATDWGRWTILMQGTATVLNLMAPWKECSLFYNFLCDHPKFFSPHSAVFPLDDQALSSAILSLRQLRVRLPSVHPLAQRLSDILKFSEDFQYSSKSMQSEQIFDKLQPLRSWLFWMPVSLVKANDMSSSAMVLLAQLYTLAIAIDASLPELSGAALGSLSVPAIEQLDRKLRSKMTMPLPGEMTGGEVGSLMEFPRLTVAQNRLDEATPHEPLHARDRQGSPYSFHRLSVGSQPGTPNYPQPGTPSYPPPGSPGLLNPWQNPSLDDLSMPPSPFLNYGGMHSRRHSGYLEMSPMPSEHSFDARSLSAYDVKGDSPAYSPAAYSPSFLPEIPDDGIWDFDVSAAAFGAESPFEEIAKPLSPFVSQAGPSTQSNAAWSPGAQQQ